MDAGSADPGTVPESVASITRRPLWRRDWFLPVMAACLSGVFLLFILLSFVPHPVKVVGTAMEPALKNGDRLMTQRNVVELNRGDIVTFYYPRDTRKSFVERIVGLPGETISIDASGAVYVDNTEIREPYVSPDRNRSPRRQQKLTLEADEYFILGDNRDASIDSRTFGPVDRKLIYGKVMWRYWPVSR